MDVVFFKLQFIKLIIEKVINILQKMLKKKKIVLFVIPELVLLKSFFKRKNKKSTKMWFDLKNITIISLVTWFFGLLTNFKHVNKKKKFIPIVKVPNMLFVLLNKISEDSDYANIAREGARINALTIGLVSSNQSPFAFDYAIPSNSSTFNSSFFYYRIFLSYMYIYNIKVYSDFYFNLIYNVK